MAADNGIVVNADGNAVSIVNPANDKFYQTSFAALIEGTVLRYDETVVALLLGLEKLYGSGDIPYVYPELIREALVYSALPDFLHTHIWTSFRDKATLELMCDQHKDKVPQIPAQNPEANS